MNPAYAYSHLYPYQPGDTPSVAPQRRDVLRFGAAGMLTALVPGQAATAAGVDLGLRRSGRSAKFNNVPLEDYKRLPNGLLIYDVVVGSGAVLQKGQRCAIHYDCRWKRLTVSTSRVGMGVTGGTPYGFDVGTKAGSAGGPFIEGLNEGVVGMAVGGQRKIIVPPELAYGKLSVQEIPPNATLDFDIELLSIKKDNVFGKARA